MRRLAGELALHGRHARRGPREGEGRWQRQQGQAAAAREGNQGERRLRGQSCRAEARRCQPMSAALHLTITTPAVILVDSDDVASVRAEDASGSFGILPSHADLLTMLTPDPKGTRLNSSHRYKS